MSLTRESLLIFGAGGHAKVIADLVEKGSEYRIAAFVDKEEPTVKSFFGYPIVSEAVGFDWISGQKVKNGIVAVGANKLRSTIVEKIKSKFPGFGFASLVHPSAQLAKGVMIGSGTVVFGGVVINSDTCVGDHCIVNTGVCFDHDGKMENFATIGPGAILGGNVTIEEFAMVSLGAKISRGVRVGANCIIGAGAVLLKSTDQVGLYFGVPATFQRPLT